VRSEALLMGGSSGGVLTALNYRQHRIPPDATVVLIFHDRGERYLDTIYSESWVKEYFGEVSSLWPDEARDPKEEEECVTMTY
jgi:N-(2-amino-2-carboxyethyl)-L-glutamate synthase